MADPIAGLNLNGLQKAGLALSNFADAAAMFGNRPTGYANAQLQQLQNLQRQLLLTQQVQKQNAAEKAQAEVAGGFDPMTGGGITWNSGRQMPSGATETLNQPSQAGLAVDSAIVETPGLANQAPEQASFTPGLMSQGQYGQAQQDFTKDQMASLRAANPAAFTQVMLQNAVAGPTAHSIPEGGKLVLTDRNGNVVREISGGDKEPEKVKQVIALYGDNWRGNPKAVDYYNKITMPMSVSLSANTQGETQFEKSQGEAWGKEAAELGPAANSARDRIGSVQQFLGLMDQVKTGKLTPTLGEVSAWAQGLGIDPATLGIDPKTATVTQVMDKIQNRLAMQNIGPGGLPANNFSEADRKFVQATTVNKANTTEANNLIAQIGIAADKRAIEKENSWLDARSRGVNFPTWKQQWSKYVESTPMFPRITDPAQLQNLPSGTLFTAPNGQIKVKP